MPIGNLTSQLFANIYLNQFDHFVKEELRVKYYIRYTDDFVLLHDNPTVLASLLPVIRAFLRDRLALELHPRKVSIRKLSQGIDFLGYVTLPHYRVLRTRTKTRISAYLEKRDKDDFAGVESYLGLLSHCNGYRLAKSMREQTYFDECWECGIMHPA